MAVNLNNESITIDTSKDSIVIMHYIDGIVGGKVLDTTNISETVLNAGHIIIKDDTTNVHKPMPISECAYGALPVGHSYVGVLATSVMTNKAFASVMLRGKVNKIASPYAVTSAMETALKHIIFTQD